MLSLQFNIGFRAWLPPIPADDHRPNLRFELQQRREAPRSVTKGHGRGGRGRQGGQGQGTTDSQAEQHNSRMRRQFPLRIGNSASPSLSLFSPLSSRPLPFFQVIAAEGEQKASRALKEASEVIAESSSALQLRYLQACPHYDCIVHKR